MTLRLVTFESRAKAEARPGWSDWAVISISEPASSEGPANLRDGWFEVLRLEFHDITEPDWRDNPAEPYVLFNEQQARVIIGFVRRCNDEGVAGILVHCKAGVSRSAAVAKWIADRYQLSFPREYELFNRHVYMTLREEHMLIGFERA